MKSQQVDRLSWNEKKKNCMLPVSHGVELQTGICRVKRKSEDD
jgi:hypothetical protein